MKPPQAPVDHETLTWARQTAGLDVETAAKKIGVSPDRLREWEANTRAPTIKQLRKLAHVFHRPIGLFFLPSLPDEADAIRDFRRLAGVALAAHALSSALRFEVRLARERREEALELASDLKQLPPTLAERCALSDDPDQVARRLRGRLQFHGDVLLC